MVNLFQLQPVTLSSGEKSEYKIECDAFVREDWECLAYLIARIFSRRKWKFGTVRGVPRGGLKLSAPLEQYATGDPRDPVLLVDDVFTTGRSMDKLRAEIVDANPDVRVIGAVVFARGTCPEWIKPLLPLHPDAI